MHEAARRATGADVAHLARVSRATVSYVLNGADQSISESTRRRVLEAAEALGYRPSPTARTLRMGRSDIVLGLLPDLPSTVVFHQAFTALGSSLRDRGLSLVVYPCPPDPQSLDGLWQAITPACVFSFAPLPDAAVERMQSAGIKVAITLTPTRAVRPWQFHYGDQSVGVAQGRHLSDRGHRHVALAVPLDPRYRALTDVRAAAVLTALPSVGRPALRQVPVPLSAVEATTVVQELVGEESPATAVAAWNDDIAAAVVAGAAMLGVDIPGRLAVIGAYDLPSGRLSNPAVTTVRVDFAARMENMARAIEAAVGGVELQLEALDTTTLEVIPRSST